MTGVAPPKDMLIGGSEWVHAAPVKHEGERFVNKDCSSQFYGILFTVFIFPMNKVQ